MECRLRLPLLLAEGCIAYECFLHRRLATDTLSKIVQSILDLVHIGRSNGTIKSCLVVLWFDFECLLCKMNCFGIHSKVDQVESGKLIGDVGIIGPQCKGLFIK